MNHFIFRYDALDKRWLLLTLGALMLASTGCDLPDRHDIAYFRKPAAWEVASKTAANRRNEEKLADLVEASAAQGTPGSDKTTAEELHSWEAYFVHRYEPSPMERLAGDPEVVGGVHFASSYQASETESDPAQVQIKMQERTLVRRPGCVYLTSNEQTFWQNVDGSLQRADGLFRDGPLLIAREAVVSKNTVQLKCNRLTRTDRLRLPFKDAISGPLAAYQTLISGPLRKGQVIKKQVFLPSAEAVAVLRMASRPSIVSRRFVLPASDARLEAGFQHVSQQEAVAILAIPNVDARQLVYWHGQDGQVHSSQVGTDQRFAYRVPKSVYQQLAKRSLDFNVPLEVTIPGKSIGNRKIRQLGLEISTVVPLADNRQDGAELNQINPLPRQYVQKRKPEKGATEKGATMAAKVEKQRQRIAISNEPIHAARLADKYQQFADEPTDADIEPTAIIDFRSASVQRSLRLAADVADFTKAERIAELTRMTQSLLTFQPLSKGIRRSSEIAEATVADSTEHSILLVAMLRAKGIPARLVMGLRYRPQAKPLAEETLVSRTSVKKPATGNRFVYHCWVIAHDGDRWRSMDAVEGGPSAATCIGLRVVDLDAIDSKSFFRDYLRTIESHRFSVFAAVPVKK